MAGVFLLKKFIIKIQTPLFFCKNADEKCRKKSAKIINIVNSEILVNTLKKWLRGLCKNLKDYKEQGQRFL